jgi:hypothetical protein
MIDSEGLMESLYSGLHSSNVGPPWLTIPIQVILVMNSRYKPVLYADEQDDYPLDSTMRDDISAFQRMAQPQKLFHATQLASP